MRDWRRVPVLGATGLGLLLVGTVAWGGRALAGGWPTRWTMMGGGPTRNAVFGQGPGVSWTFRAGGPIIGPATVVDGVVYFGTNRGRVDAVSARSGRALWSVRTGNMVMSTPVVVGNQVFVGEGNNQMLSTSRGLWVRGVGANGIYALNRLNGKVEWFRRTRGEDMGGMAYSGGRLYAADGSHWLYALAPATGRVIWRVKDGGVDSMSSLAVNRGVVYVVTGGPSEPSLKAFAASDGRRIWASGGHGNSDNSPTIAHGLAYEENAVQFQDHGHWWFQDVVEALRGRRIVWSLTTGAGPLPPEDGRHTLIYACLLPFATPPVTVKGNVVYAGSTSSGKVYAISATSGKLLWKTHVGSTDVNPVVVGNRVYTTTKSGRIVALSAATGRIVGTQNLGGHFGPAYPTVVDGTVYVGNANGNLYARPLSAIARG